MSDFDPDAYLSAPVSPPEQGAQQQAPSDGGQSPVSDFDPDSYLQDKAQEQYGTAGEQALTVAENAAKGLAGPLATGAERIASWGAGKLGLDNVSQELSPEAQEARAEANPGEAKTAEYGTLAGSFLMGAGEARLLMGVGKAASEAAGFGKLGSAVIRGMVEGGLLGAGDATSNVINGHDVDPEAPVASALSHIGAGGLLGAVTGGGTGGLFDLAAPAAGKALRALSDTRVGNGASKLIQDFGNRWNLIKTMGSVPDAVASELTNLHEGVSAATDATRGSSGLKSQAVDLLAQAVKPESVQSHVGDVSRILESVPPELQESRSFQNAKAAWETATSSAPDSSNIFATPKQAGAGDVFKATDELKRKMAEIVYGPGVATRSEMPMLDAASKLRGQLQGSLEDSGNWGRLGKLQADINSATHDLLPSLKDFNSKATLKVEGVPTVDPDKITNLVRGFGNDKKVLQKGMVGNFVTNAQKYMSRVNDLYGELGIPNGMPHVSTNETDNVLHGTLSPGAKFADFIHGSGVNSFSTKVANTVGGISEGVKHGGIAGGIVGGMIGHALPLIEQAIGRPVKEHAVPFVLRALGSGKPEALIEALSHAENVYKGQNAMQTAVNGLFAGAKIAGVKSYASEEKIKKFVDENGLDKQMEDAASPSTQSASSPMPSFAAGGEVNGQQPMVSPKVASPDNGGKMGEAFPDQSMMMGSAKARVYGYLKAMRPQEDQPKLLFDSKHKNPMADKKYATAVKVAADPLSVLSHVQEGTLQPDVLGHFKQMWPEIHSQISQKITKQAMEAQLKGDPPPPYKIRQGLSLFMGTPLESNLTPQNIQAAQATFAIQKAQPQGGGTSMGKKKAEKLDDAAGQYRTSQQASVARQNRVKP